MTAPAAAPLAPPANTDPFAAVPIPGQQPTNTNNSSSNQTNQLANIQASQLAAQVANWAAQLEFAKERFRLLELPQAQQQSQLAIDQLAFQKASTAWQQAFEEASLKGTYQGVPTTQWLTQQAQLTGTLNGSQTLQGKLTDAQIAQMNSAMQIAMKNQDLQERQFGFQQTQWNAEFGLQKAAQDMQYGGYTSTGAPTLQREQVENASAQQYLTLLGSLRGPQNAFAQARVIGNTPGSIRDIANQWLGKYQIGGTTGSGMNPTPINPSNMMGANGVQYGPGGTDAGLQGQTVNGFTFGVAAPPPAPTGQPAFGSGATPGAPYVDPYAGYQYPTLPPYQAPGAPAAPAAGAAGFSAVPSNDGPIPGKGLDPTQWNDATKLAVQQWNAMHPGFQANGSQLGYGYVGPVTPNAGAMDFSNVPGRGLAPSQWNPATRAAVAAWNASHPGYVANGSQAGYAFAGAAEAGGDPNATVPGGAPAPASGQGVGTPPTAGVGTTPPVSPAPAAGSQILPPQNVTPGSHSSDSIAAATATQASPVTPGTSWGPALSGSQAPSYYAEGATPAAAPAAAPVAPGIAAPQNVTNVTSAAGETAIYSPPGIAAPQNSYNYTPTASGGVTVHPPGVASDPSQAQMSTNTPASQDDLSSWFSNVLPNQINARNYNNTNEYNQQLGWAALEDQGWDIGAAQDAFKKSLPRYTGPTSGSFAGLS